MPFKTALEAALAHLKSKGEIKYDNDIMEPLGIKSKGTVSNYASGSAKISGKFKEKFENYFKIKLSDFEHLVEVQNNKSEEPKEIGSKEEDLREIIALLKKDVTEKEARVKDLLEVTGRIKKVEEMLSDIRKDMNNMAALQKGYQEYWAEHYPPKGSTAMDVMRSIHSKALASLQKIEKEGIQI